MSVSSTTSDSDSSTCIIDAELPNAVNFSYLKNSGIEQLQNSVGAAWSNYNDSDPGVTILDQLCYALTELGYCAQFPVADVLTGAEGKIHYYDQFFEPQDILTTSPVTTDDYRRLVHDHIQEVRVVYIIPEKTSLTSTAMGSSADSTTGNATDSAVGSSTSNTTANAAGTTAVQAQPTYITGRYQTYLSLQPTVPASDLDAILQRVYVLLNQHRNIAEVFLLPQPLTPQVITLLGNVVLTPTADATQIQSQLLEAFRNYTAPLPVRSGYLELIQKGMTADQIFNGPKMQKGWICGSTALGQKCSAVSLFQLYSLIAAIPGVAYVESLSFSPASLVSSDDTSSSINIAPAAIADIELDPTFSLWQNGVVVSGVTVATATTTANSQNYLEAMKSRHQASSIEASAELYPPLPQGTYREIEQYYSVQNTFPDPYNIGQNSLQSDAPSYKVARSRQLKGYLMPFDQLLANQFSQLAHLGDLFSFHPPRKYVNKPQQIKSNAVPVDVKGIPYKRFSLTYFCQPLYQIPNVKPLLAGHDAFRYQFVGSGTTTVIEQAEWNAYKQFPFNPYMYGLQQGMESDREANIRRDTMLNHLMARHGDESSAYDEVIKTHSWVSSEIKTRIVVKSIWLQNFQKLSYHRPRAFDFLSQTTLPLPDLTTTRMMPPTYPTIDGEPDQVRIYAEARLRRSDFEDFSAFELKAGILFNLPKYFFNLTGKLNGLLADSGFAQWLASPAEARAPYYLPESDVSVICGVHTNNTEDGCKDQVYEGQQCLLDIVWTNGTPPSMADYQAYAAQLLWFAEHRQGMLLIEPVLLLPTSSPPSPLTDANAQGYFLTACLLLPGYVSLIQQISFQQSLATLQELHWPTHVTLHYTPSTFSFLKAFIPNFVLWNNSQHTLGKANNFSASLARQLNLPALEGSCNVPI